MGRAEHLLTQSVTYSTKTGRSSDGSPTYGSQVTINARWEEKSQLVVNSEGAEVSALGRLICETEIPLLSRIWLPGYNTAVVNDSKKPIAKGKAQTPDGFTLYEVWL